MDKIEVSQRAREAAFDAYLTCYETVPNDLWLQALLDGKHDGDEMAQAFARFERDILATHTDATPVARMDFNTLEVAIGEGLIMDLDMDDDNDLARIEWVSTSIANRICKAGNTAATDVAALVDAAKALVQQVGLQNTRVYRTDPAMQSLIAALAPFTKGQP